MPRLYQSSHHRPLQPARCPGTVGAWLASIVLLAASAGCRGSNEDLESVSSPLIAAAFKGWNQVPTAGMPGGIFSTGPGGVVVRRFQLSEANIYLFARGTDNLIYRSLGLTTNNWVTASWSAWTSMSNLQMLGRPAATRLPFAAFAEGVAVVARGTNNRALVSVTSLDSADAAPQEFGNWHEVGTQALADEPAATWLEPDYLYVFGNAANGQVYWSRNRLRNSVFDPKTWEAWTGPIPAGVLTAPPAAVSRIGVLYVAGRGTDNHFYVTKSADLGATWTAWFPVSASLTFSSGPALTVSGRGQLSILGTLASNGHMYGLTSNNSGATWVGGADAGGVLTSAPAASASTAAEGSMQTFARGTDNTIYWNRYQE